MSQMKKLLVIIITLMIITLTACNTAQTYTWLDADGTVLHTQTVTDGTQPSFNLPLDTEAWDYKHWTNTGNNEQTAVREPKYSFFVGNVFQIIVFDLGRIPISTGTGFVFNDEGWFITNDHVMEEGYFAEAIFDIPDATLGESFTKLNINLAAHRHVDKDIFIGKLTNYNKIKNNYYQEFTFQTEYKVDDLTYSVGYPDSSILLQINEGNIVSDLSSIYDKVYSGITYIGSTSFIAPGSSGGILLNNKLEILGMTTIGITDNSGKFKLGGAIAAFNYVNQINVVKNSDLKDYAVFLHPTEKVFIGYFKEAVAHEGTKSVKTQFSDYTRYTYTTQEEGVNSGGTAYTYTDIFKIDSNGWMSNETTYYWGNGDRRVIKFYGYWSHSDGLNNFIYEFTYTWGSGGSHTLKSTNINYSTNLALTLNQYTTTGNPSSSNIEYAKEQFNYIYEWLTNDMARFK